MHIKKAPGTIVLVTEDFHIKLNEILKDTKRKLTELLMVEYEKVIAKTQLVVDNSVNANYRGNVEAKGTWLLDRNKH